MQISITPVRGWGGSTLYWACTVVVQGGGPESDLGSARLGITQVWAWIQTWVARGARIDPAVAAEYRQWAAV